MPGKKYLRSDYAFATILGYVILQIVWIFLWSFILLVTFPGDRVGEPSFFPWTTRWGSFIANLIYTLPIFLSTLIVYLFTSKSLKLAFWTFMMCFLLFILGSTFLMDGAFVASFTKDFKYAFNLK